MKKIEIKDPSKVVITPHPPVNDNKGTAPKTAENTTDPKAEINPETEKPEVEDQNAGKVPEA